LIIHKVALPLLLLLHRPITCQIFYNAHVIFMTTESYTVALDHWIGNRVLGKENMDQFGVAKAG